MSEIAVIIGVWLCLFVTTVVVSAKQGFYEDSNSAASVLTEMHGACIETFLLGIVAAFLIVRIRRREWRHPASLVHAEMLQLSDEIMSALVPSDPEFSKESTYVFGRLNVPSIYNHASLNTVNTYGAVLRSLDQQSMYLPRAQYERETGGRIKWCESMREKIDRAIQTALLAGEDAVSPATIGLAMTLSTRLGEVSFIDPSRSEDSSHSHIRFGQLADAARELSQHLARTADRTLSQEEFRLRLGKLLDDASK